MDKITENIIEPFTIELLNKLDYEYIYALSIVLYSEISRNV